MIGRHEVEWQTVETIPSYNLPDIFALGLVLFCALRGLMRGLSGELARLLTILLALAAALRLREPLGEFIGAVTRLETPVDIALGFTLIVIAVLMILTIVRRLLKRIMQVTFTPGLEKGGGLAAGMLRGTVLVMTVFILLNLWPHEYLNRKFGEESLVGSAVGRVLPRLREQWERIEREPAGREEQAEGVEAEQP